MRHAYRLPKVCLAVIVLVAMPLGAAATPAFQYNIVSVKNLGGSSVVSPGNFAVITFSVTNPQTGAFYNLTADPAWTATGGNSRLFLQIGWNTSDFNNTDSGTLGGPALPIAVNALAGATHNLDGTYTITAGLPIPVTATGTGEVAMEGHPAGPDPVTGLYTVRIPVRSVYKIFPITDAAAVARRQIVDGNKCMVCHKSDGTGVAPRLTLHGNNRTEEIQVCVVCHNPDNTDITYRNINPKIVNGVAVNINPVVKVGSYTYPEQSIDFKRLIHGIHASTIGFRRNPLVAVGFNGTIFDASTLTRFPASLSRCTGCHISNPRLPLMAAVRGSTVNTLSSAPNANGSFVINYNSADNIRISPTASVCSSCHDSATSHMVSTGGASFNTTQAALDSGAVVERCANCHRSHDD